MYGLSPFYYVLIAFVLLIVGAALWVVIDSASPRRKEKYGTKSLLIYQIYCGVLVVAYLSQQIFALIPVVPPGFRNIWGLVTALLIFFAVPVILTYLLSVVFPSRPKGETPSEDVAIADIEDRNNTDIDELESTGEELAS